MAINPEKQDSSFLKPERAISPANSNCYEESNNTGTNSTSESATGIFPKINREGNQDRSMHTESSRQSPWWQTWQLWAIMLVLISGGIGYGATSLLLRLPKAQSCSKVFWPVASASIRLYCAQIAAEKNSVESLLEAIALVDILPPNHPLRPEINRNVEKWATAILEIGETKFQEGNLEAAVAIAQKIPEDVEAHNLVEAKIANWQSIWAKAEETYAEVEKQLRASNWNQALVWAVRLTNSENQYWANTKYQETIDKINIAQEESSTLDRAYNQLRQGRLDDWFEAIARAQAIRQDSYAYQEAQDLIAEGKDRLLKHIQNLIDNQNWRELLQVTHRLPSGLELQEQAVDWNILANAGSSADVGTVYGLEDAIIEAEKLPANSPYYPKAQSLIARWKLEIEDVKHLTQARQLAEGGGVERLNAAIAEASRIAPGNPRYREAQQTITDWRRQLQIIEDRPILERAKQLAFEDNISAWQRAIAEASLISSTSPLYPEAQEHVNTWKANIETVEDRPFLEQAIDLASMRNYTAAIETAQKIRPGRALYPNAQEKISTWRQEMQGREYLQQAYDLANRGTPEALAEAIRIARQVSSSTTIYDGTVEYINRWSTQILALAQAESQYSLERAIAIAEMVPSGTTSYEQAQSQIQAWQQILRPPAFNRPLRNDPVREISLENPNNQQTR
ncbi:chromosome segregation ATPase [Pleurocapsales cyanobacterium LEGE 06147]|nr:chromosome segregation ATPase [Pleurocapsales cyanobacterium LEGE 06147]